MEEMAKSIANASNAIKKKTSPSFYVSVVYVVSILLFNISNPLIPHIIFLIWLAITIVCDGRQLGSILSRKYYLAFYCFLLYYFASSLSAFSPGTCVNRVYTYLELVSPFIMYELYSGYDKKTKRILVLVFLAIYAVNFYQMLTTINYSAIAGLRQHEDEEGYLNTGFNFIYSLSLVLTLLLYVFRKRSFKDERLLVTLLIVWTLSIIFIVFKSLYTTAIMLMGVGAVLAFFYGRKNWKSKLLVVGVVLILLFIYLVPYVEKQLLSIDSEYALITYRLNEISSSLSGEGIDADASGGARLNRTLVSLNTFLHYPLFGVNHLTANREIFDGVLIGNHAEWVDSMAEYGVFSFLLFFFLIKSAKRVARNRGLNAVFLLYVIIGFLNPVMYCVQNTICFFIIPIFHDCLIPSESN